ncbi:unnamed protein product [[Candida] boidinii]|uniref:Unnamed protein product n=1 Tax=Candida boidinii TaxID=5477 RepID=A0ACB5TM28_CANBO|nr:unnamed protein product [[Candida] boidinii]
MQFRNVILASILSALAVQAADVVTQIGDGQIQAPAETPVETPAETTTETPVETPAETPAETTTEAPVETPAETPVTVTEEETATVNVCTEEGGCVETEVSTTTATVCTKETCEEATESDVYVDVTSTPLTTVINPEFQTTSDFVTITSTYCDDTDICGESSAPSIEIQTSTTCSGNCTSPDIESYEGGANRITMLSAGVLGFAGLAFLL